MIINLNISDIEVKFQAKNFIKMTKVEKLNSALLIDLVESQQMVYNNLTAFKEIKLTRTNCHLINC